MKTVHIFEKAQLGTAPFRLLRVDMIEQDPNGPRRGTSCDHCGTYITNLFFCESSDGKKFVIGSTCAEKLGDAGLTKAVRTEVSNHRRELRNQRQLAEWEAARPAREAYQQEQAAQKAALIAERKELFKTLRPTLATMPHPNEYFASKGKTMIDYLNYFHGDIDNVSDDFWTYGSKALNILEGLK